jgi:hypothetical protein
VGQHKVKPSSQHSPQGPLEKLPKAETTGRRQEFGYQLRGTCTAPQPTQGPRESEEGRGAASREPREVPLTRHGRGEARPF